MRQHSLGTEGKTGNVIQHSCQALLLQDNDIVLLSFSCEFEETKLNVAR